MASITSREDEGAEKKFQFSPNTIVGAVEIAVPVGVAVFGLEAMQNDASNICAGIKSRGENNRLYLGSGADVSKLRFDIAGKHHKVIVGANCVLKGSISLRGVGATVFIGAHTTFNSVNIICKYADVYIGRDCMFSSGIEVRTSDSHAVIDLEQNARTNGPEGVYIGDHVWVGKGAVIGRGSVVGSDNIVGMDARVRGDFSGSSTIIAGAPARVVRTGKSWSRDEFVDPAQTDIYAWRALPLV